VFPIAHIGIADLRSSVKACTTRRIRSERWQPPAQLLKPGGRIVTLDLKKQQL
jgi:hypothetical protein